MTQNESIPLMSGCSALQSEVELGTIEDALAAVRKCTTKALGFEEPQEVNLVRNLMKTLIDMVQRLNRLHSMGVDLQDCHWRVQDMLGQLQEVTVGLPTEIRTRILDVFSDSWNCPTTSSDGEKIATPSAGKPIPRLSFHSIVNVVMAVQAFKRLTKTSKAPRSSANITQSLSSSSRPKKSTLSAQAAASRLQSLHDFIANAQDGPGSCLLLQHPSVGEITLNFSGISGQVAALDVAPDVTVHDLKERLAWAASWVPSVLEQKLVFETCALSDDTATLKQLKIPTESNITVLRVSFCQRCDDAPCKCAVCHGWGQWYGDKICRACGLTPPRGCNICRGRCRCSTCHGMGGTLSRGCKDCGKIRAPSCWSGDTHVIVADGTTKKVRECQVGDEVCTVQGSRRIARIWDSEGRQEADTEVCRVGSVWMTSHHPMIHGQRWVFPADLAPTQLWKESRDLVPDLYNFELEGHDDTIVLWGGPGCQELVVSCTIGKYLGPAFGRGMHTRRSTRCHGACSQCDAVYMEGIDFGNVPSELRWATFPEFPEVDWESAPASEFDLAASLKERFSLLHRSGSCATEANQAKLCLCEDCDVSKKICFSAKCQPVAC